MGEGQHAGAAPRHPEEQRGQRRQCDSDRKGEVLPGHAGQHQHHGGNAGQHQRSAEVGLFDDKKDEDDGDNGGAQQRALPVVDAVQARGKKPGHEENQRGLGNLGRLKGEQAAEANPAMGVVRVAEKVDHDQQQHGDGNNRIDEARRVVAAVVDGHEEDHAEDAAEGPAGLAADECEGGMELLGDDNGRRGKDHGQPNHNQQQGGEEDPLVDADSFCHRSLPTDLQNRRRGFAVRVYDAPWLRSSATGQPLRPCHSFTNDLKTRPRCS